MVQFRTVCLSAHLDSFCRKLDELRGLEFVYEFEDPGEERRRVGWRMDAEYRNGPITPENTERAKSCELLYDMLREFDLFEVRAQKGLKTVYAGERWLKPIPVASFKLFERSVLIRLPGVVRLLVPRYRKMARRFVKLMDDPNFYVFPIGVPAVRDMVRIYRVLKGDWRAFFREPKVEIERKLGGSVEGFPRMKLWGYFVEPSRSGEEGAKAKDKAKAKGEGEGVGDSEQRKALAVRKVEEWLTGVTRESFDAALLRLVNEKISSHEYRFKRVEDQELALAGAQRFFDEFSRKIVQLSDGRCVYFAPDARSKERNANDLSRCWAEYAFHAVSSSGKMLEGRNYRERIFNVDKLNNVKAIDVIVAEEHCMFRLIDDHPENDAVIFIGRDEMNGRVEVITRLDEYGNAKANLGEVTVIVQHSRKKPMPPPKFRPLTEVVEAVAKHQAAGFSPSTTANNISNFGFVCNRAQRTLRILWIGRMLDLKRVDTLIRAFRRVRKQRSAALLLIGEGPERAYLERLAGADRVVWETPEWQDGKIVFHDYIKNDIARELMRCADVYVMPSNGEDGWGAVVSEALTEGCPVISTFEVGGSATLLPDGNLFHAGDVAALARLLVRFSGEMVEYDSASWCGANAAAKLLEIVE